MPSPVPISIPTVWLYTFEITTKAKARKLNLSPSSTIFCQYFMSLVSPRGIVNGPITCPVPVTSSVVDSIPSTRSYDSSPCPMKYLSKLKPDKP